MSKIKVDVLPSVPKKIWLGYKKLLAKCRAMQALGFGQGTPSYEAALTKLKHYSCRHGLLLGHVSAIADEHSREHA